MPTRKTPIPRNARCLICGTDLSTPVFDCPECSTPHHAMCWQWAGGCAVYGCRRAARQVREPERAAEMEAIAAADRRQRERLRTPAPVAPPVAAPPDHAPQTAAAALEWVRGVVVLLILSAAFASPPKAPKASGAFAARMPGHTVRAHTSPNPLMERLSEADRAADTLVRDDSGWVGTGNEPGPRLRRMMVAREGEALRSGVSRLATRPLPDWVRARVQALQRVAGGGLDLHAAGALDLGQLALRRP